MASTFARVEDIELLFRRLTSEERRRAAALLPVVSDLIRSAGMDAGKDIDAAIAASASYGAVVKIVTVDVVSRILRQDTSGEPMSQESQAAMGYSWSGTYAIPGGGVGGALMNNDLKRLGLRKQTAGVIELYDPDQN